MIPPAAEQAHTSDPSFLVHSEYLKGPICRNKNPVARCKDETFSSPNVLVWFLVWILFGLLGSFGVVSFGRCMGLMFICYKKGFLAGKMVQWVKGLSAKTWKAEFNLQNPCKTWVQLHGLVIPVLGNGDGQIFMSCWADSLLEASGSWLRERSCLKDMTGNDWKGCSASTSGFHTCHIKAYKCICNP